MSHGSHCFGAIHILHITILPQDSEKTQKGSTISPSLEKIAKLSFGKEWGERAASVWRGACMRALPFREDSTKPTGLHSTTPDAVRSNPRTRNTPSPPAEAPRLLWEGRMLTCRRGGHGWGSGWHHKGRRGLHLACTGPSESATW